MGEPLEVRDDVHLDNPGDRDVLVRIAASGVCHTDLSIQEGSIPHRVPCVLGHEGAGEILAVGKDVEAVSVGDHVVISWIPSCGRCTRCLGGQANLCRGNRLGADGLPARHLRIGGEPVWAGLGTATFAERTVVPVDAVVRIPLDVPLDLAALVGCGVTTGVGAAMFTAKVRPGATVIVFGCGGVGVNVIQGARIAGAAEIVAVDSLPAKFELARHFGATHTTTPDGVAELVETLTDGEGFDDAFEVVGSSATIRAAFDATRRGGTCVVGAGRADELVSFNAFELFSSEKHLIGSLYGSADVRTDFDQILRLWRYGRLDLERLITRRIDLSEINAALSAVKHGDVLRTVIEFR